MITPHFDFEFDGLDGFLSDIEELVEDLAIGISTEGDAANYALVWEWGNARQTEPGPKTVLGTNPDGQMVWLSIQAPFGYIRRNEETFWQLFHFEMNKIDWAQPNVVTGNNESALKVEVTKHLNNVAKGMAQIVQEDAPVDSGELQSSIKPVLVGDILLNQVGDDYETLELIEEQ